MPLPPLRLSGATTLAMPSPADILANARSSRPMIQDFTPLADSIEWELGQVYLRERGSQAFLRDAEPVPFVVNNDGTLSQLAAEVFFASLLAAERDGPLPRDLFVLELGIGVGLFARFFLDHLYALCTRHGKDYYDRLTYVAADRSRKMLEDAGRHGIFANHPGHYVLRLADALDPARDLGQDPLLAAAGPRPFRAVFLNYLLDCLPATVLRFDGEETAQLCVRTCLARNAPAEDFPRTRVAELARRAASADARDRRELLEVYGLLVSEYAYRPVELATIPYGAFAQGQARAWGQATLLHSHGTIQSLERLLEMIVDGGFILINDYGSTQPEGAEEFQHQRFSHATFAGINFPLLAAFFKESRGVEWVEPAEDEVSVHPRLLSRQPARQTVAAFRENFGKLAREQLEGPVQRARECLKQGRLEVTLGLFQQALEQQPYNWPLMVEAAQLLTFGLRNPAAGLEMARAALGCNPVCSAEVSSTVGDCLFELGRTEEARHAYLRALRVNPDDVRARLNLAFVYTRERDYALALGRIAEALALDQAGAFREGLLRKQEEVLARLAGDQQQHQLRWANRVSAPPASMAATPKVAANPAPPRHVVPDTDPGRRSP